MTEAFVRTLLSPTRRKRRLFYAATDAAVVVVASLLTCTVAAYVFMPTFARFATFVLPYAGLGLACRVGLSVLLSSYNLRWSTCSLADVPRPLAPGARFREEKK
jgi:hypothetical protein